MNETYDVSGFLTIDKPPKINFQDIVLRVLLLIQYFLIFPIIAGCILYLRKWMRAQGLFMNSRELDSFLENGANEKIDDDTREVRIS
jgi:hypothetical protein